MGIAGMAALTHEMEDVFELLRQRQNGLQRSEIDVLLECLDSLEAAVDAIEASGDEAITPGALIERVRELVRDALAARHIAVSEAATGGARGRSIRVDAAAGTVTFREAGGAGTQLHPATKLPDRTLQEVA